MGRVDDRPHFASLAKAGDTYARRSGVLLSSDVDSQSDHLQTEEYE